MKDICALVASYLSVQLNRPLGKEVFYYQMPNTADKCLCVQRARTGIHVPIQIDAAVHRIRIAARAKSSDEAYMLAEEAYNLLSAAHDTLTEAPGFITLSDEANDIAASVRLYDSPQWDSQDQQGRKVFDFDAMLITKR